MKHLFIPYELAVIAKEKGFDEPCFTYWFTIKGKNPQLHYKDCSLNGWLNYIDSNTIAPLYQQIIDWFREKHNIHILPRLSSSGYCWEITYNSITQFYPFASDYNIGRDRVIEEAFKLINL